MDDKTYLSYLLQSLNVDDLKQLCRDYQIRGFSKWTKAKLIENLLDSLAEEEISEVLKQKELVIISNAIDLAINKINGIDRESISEIKVVNPKTHEVEINFKGINWNITSYLSITPKNIKDPERDCDCRIGSNMGFCSHFWVGFILSLKQNYFKLTDWKLTRLPKDFNNKIKSIKLSTSTATSGKGTGKSGALSLIDEQSDGFQLMGHLNSSITVYEGKITEMLERESDFQGNITTYYLVSLEKVKFGPKLKKASDFREEDLETVDKLKVRISERLKNDNVLKEGNKIKFSGRLNKDSFLGFMVKNVRKVEKLS
jgi:hypothetical protein